VGCVIVKDGVVVGEGFHRRAGEPHAERLALTAAGDAARGATVYVTLEPCCHHGRTPPCTEALIAAGVAEVVSAMQDPNPNVSGEGHAALAAAGIATRSGLFEDEARALNPGFIRRMEKGRPYVRCKLAMSLDGRTATATGESQWITCEASRRDVQRLRARSSAILTGIGTVLADDPSLNVRLGPGELPGTDPDYPPHQPLRVVLDSGLRMLADARLLSLPGGTWIVCAGADPDRQAALEASGARIEVVPGERGRASLSGALDRLAACEINEVLIESGPKLAGTAVREGLVDELIVYVAPHLMGHEGRALVNLPGLASMADRIALEFVDMRPIGTNLRITARPVRE
jgi:diaminohydroxyphosphoribosylaminopyrimidine deaminase/5-amino-6-(5-phosphoribosylamino)uracil reductase